MTARGLRVPRSRGESVRRDLIRIGRLRSDLEIRKEGEFLVLPVTDGEGPLESWGEVVQHDFDPRREAGPADYRGLLDWPGEEKRLLPRAFDVVGDVVLVRLPRELDSRKEEVGAALLRFVPGARIVGVDHGVRGPERRRSVERIAGAGSWRTRHRENGVELDVDVERAYFSPRLAREHERVAREVQTGDRVYDLCCGVGPFAVTIARGRRATHVTAVDANPEAIALLRETLRRYPFGGTVEPLEAEIEEFLRAAVPVERVILNLPHEGIKYLPSVARAVAPRGRLYYYEVTARAEFERRAEAIVGSLGSGEAWTVADRHVVHPYSPSSDVVAFVLERSGA